MIIEVSNDMLQAAENIRDCPVDESYWMHLATATYNQMIAEGIIAEDDSE